MCCRGSDQCNTGFILFSLVVVSAVCARGAAVNLKDVSSGFELPGLRVLERRRR